jgi:2-dehydro-3-deoxyphosphooctonate aldolase (KDO 8-P synthase)
MKAFQLDHINFCFDNPLVLIAGPCVIENRDHCLKMAAKLQRVASKYDIPFIFKSSFLKANRSSIDSYLGPGLEAGLRILARVKSEMEIPVISDIHSIEQVKPAAEVLDVIQIPAFLCRQTALLIAAAETGRALNVKKGQFLSPWDVKNIIGKVHSTGNHKLLMTERGVTFGYNNLVVDMRALEIMRRLGVAVVFDATHSVQLPGGQGGTSGGQREFVDPLTRAALAVGVNALFLEVHDNPQLARCDGPNMITPEYLDQKLPLWLNIDALIKQGTHRDTTR